MPVEIDHQLQRTGAVSVFRGRIAQHCNEQGEGRWREIQMPTTGEASIPIFGIQPDVD